jgi:hypoxanthine phosphoribosyltransferase
MLLSADQIDQRIRDMGSQIDLDYPDGSLHLVCILKGACFFLADLARAIRRDVVIDFMGISSYGRGKTTSGAVKLTKDLDMSVEGADVLLVEDIVDSGVTLNYLTVAYVGFQIPDEFVVGYGLDFAERYRNLRDVCVLEGPEVA